MRSVSAQPDTSEVLAGLDLLPREIFVKIFLALSDERDMWERRLQAAASREYERGLREGTDRGWHDGRAHEYACWMMYHGAAHEAALRLSRSRTYIELEILRYAPSGWKGKIPRRFEHDSTARRRWLAALPNPRHSKPGKAAR